MANGDDMRGRSGDLGDRNEDRREQHGLDLLRRALRLIGCPQEDVEQAVQEIYERLTTYNQKLANRDSSFVKDSSPFVDLATRPRSLRDR